MSQRRRDPAPAAVRDAGFSLVEALVALFLFGAASVGLMQLQAQSVRLLDEAETRSLAGLVAQNRLVEALASRTPPAVGETSGEATLAGRDWAWTMTVEPTQDAGMVQVKVRVFEPDGGAQAASAAAFTPTPRTTL